MVGLLSAKTCATGIRGQYYSVAAASGKIGAFIGTFIFPVIQARAPGGPSSTRAGQDPFIVRASLCLFSAGVAYWLLPDVGQDTIVEEDRKFRAFLEAEGWDTSKMGVDGRKGEGNGKEREREQPRNTNGEGEGQ